MKTLFTLLGALLTIVACTPTPYQVIGSYDATKESFDGVVIPKENAKNCPHLPDNFDPSNLVGTWVTTAGALSGKMRLILKEDKTYQQIYDYPPTGYHYEGDWQKWEVESKDKDTPELHLTGMKSCRDECRSNNGSRWYDFCNNQMISFENEVILLLVGDTARFATPPPLVPVAPRGIMLFHPLSDPDSNPMVFQLQR
jgi:hypothetical protein